MKQNNDNYIDHYGQEMYKRGLAGGKLLAISLLHFDLLRYDLGRDPKFLDILNNLREKFDEELNKTLEGK
jgi:hypothetical protein